MISSLKKVLIEPNHEYYFNLGIRICNFRLHLIKFRFILF